MSSMDSTLQPMSTGQVLDRTFHLYRNNFLLFAGISALPPAVILLRQPGSVNLKDRCLGKRDLHCAGGHCVRYLGASLVLQLSARGASLRPGKTWRGCLPEAQQVSQQRQRSPAYSARYFSIGDFDL